METPLKLDQLTLKDVANEILKGNDGIYEIITE